METETMAMIACGALIVIAVACFIIRCRQDAERARKDRTRNEWVEDHIRMELGLRNLTIRKYAEDTACPCCGRIMRPIVLDEKLERVPQFLEPVRKTELICTRCAHIFITLGSRF